MTLVTGTRGGPTPFGRALLDAVSSSDGWVRTGARPGTGRPEFEKTSEGWVVRVGTFPNGTAFAGLAGRKSVPAASVEAAVAAANQILIRTRSSYEADEADAADELKTDRRGRGDRRGAR